MKKIMAVVLALVLLVMPGFSTLAAYESADIYITLDGLLKPTEVQPVIVDGYTMVSLREISELLNAKVDWKPDTKTVTVKMSNQYVEMKVGNKVANINYIKVDMPIAPVIVNDRVMVPLRFISEKFNLNVDWNEEKHLVALSSGKQIYSVLDARPEVELGENGIEMTFSQAVEQINKNDTTLKNLADQYDVLKREKKELDDDVDKVGSIANGMSKIYTFEEVEAFKQQRAMKNSIKNLQINESLVKDGNVLQLKNALTEIDKTDLDIYLLQEKIKLDETNLSNMQLKLSLGLETESNIKNLENSIAKDKISLNTLEIKQNNNNLTLNKLLGIDANKKVKITGFDIEAADYEDNVDLFVQEQLKNAPLMSGRGTELRIDLDNATFAKTAYYELLLQYLRYEKTKDNEEPWELITMENNITTAQRALDDAKIALEQKIRTTYNSIKQMEQSYESLKVDYEIAKDSYEKVVMNYVTGYATVFDVQQAQFGLLNAEAALLSNRISYRTVVESYKMPYLSQQ